jgi:hypothetical protein
MKKYLVILVVLPLSMLCLLTGLWLIASFIEWDFRAFPIKSLDGKSIRVLLLGDLIISLIIFGLFTGELNQSENE